jgi:organic radical activating enzyme
MNDSKTFCVLPWIHTHLNTEGDVFPCCVSWNPERSSRAGWLKDNTLEEIFNNDFMRQLRLDMLNGIERPDVCSNCYDREKGGFQSARQGYNSDHQDEDTKQIIASTADDGYVEPRIKSWDIRFSNLCNLKCRTCGPLFSTTWAQEDETANYFKIQAIPEGAEDPLANQYDNVEKLYFAGGEPLIMPEHYKTLKELIKRSKAKNVRIIYNSNLTKLDYNNNDLVQLWKEFDKVVIGASLDAVGARAEYIRHGQPWSNIEKNLKRLMEFKNECPTFDFYISPTVGVLNVTHLPDMHQYLWNNKLMPYINSINFNLLLYPKHYDCRILPNEIKEQTAEKISAHENWLLENGASTHTIKEYANLRNYLMQDIDKKELQNFINVTRAMDKKRNENFNSVFEEYTEIGI